MKKNVKEMELLLNILILQNSALHKIHDILDLQYEDLMKLMNKEKKKLKKK